MVGYMTTAVSLFAGVGGFDLALERAGVKVVASVEWDKHAQNVLRKQFPNAEVFGDIQGVSGEQLRAAGFNPDDGIITGGFPCQDLSVAGKRAGLAGLRSGLFWEICRLLDETRTQNFILENVPGLLSSNNGRDMAVVIEALVERGYRIAWRVLDAQYFGVPQRRRRVFIVGCLGNSGRSPEEILAIAEGRARYLAKSNEKRKDTAGASARSSQSSSAAGNFELYDFPDESIAPTMSAQRARDTMTWWNGEDVADTITRTSSEQRMPDKNRLQAVINVVRQE
jgi:DNA (cytosine-5)-methyltransferase 1